MLLAALSWVLNLVLLLSRGMCSLVLKMYLFIENVRTWNTCKFIFCQLVREICFAFERKEENFRLYQVICLCCKQLKRD